jgi:hypothetical protein
MVPRTIGKLKVASTEVSGPCAMATTRVPRTAGHLDVIRKRNVDHYDAIGDLAGQGRELLHQGLAISEGHSDAPPR